jgi:hypothetical protein
MQKCALSRKNISLDIHYIVYLKCIGAIYRIKFPDGGAEFRMFHLYHCKDCDEVFAFTGFDHSPQYQYLPEKGIYREENLEERVAHTAKHDGHHLKKLRLIKGTMISERDYREPVKETYFEATNGRERFVIKKWRGDINEPMSYELIPGSLKIINYVYEVREREIKKEWLRVTSQSLHEKGMIFLTALKESLPSAKISKDSRMTFHSSNPLVSYQRLSQHCIRMVLKMLRHTFTPLEMKEVREFIHEQNQHDGVLPILIRKSFYIEKAEEHAAHKEQDKLSVPLRIKRISESIRPAEQSL